MSEKMKEIIEGRRKGVVSRFTKEFVGRKLVGIDAISNSLKLEFEGGGVLIVETDDHHCASEYNDFVNIKVNEISFEDFGKARPPLW